MTTAKILGLRSSSASLGQPEQDSGMLAAQRSFVVRKLRGSFLPADFWNSLAATRFVISSAGCEGLYLRLESFAADVSRRPTDADLHRKHNTELRGGSPCP